MCLEGLMSPCCFGVVSMQRSEGANRRYAVFNARGTVTGWNPGWICITGPSALKIIQRSYHEGSQGGDPGFWTRYFHQGIHVPNEIRSRGVLGKIPTRIQYLHPRPSSYVGDLPLQKLWSRVKPVSRSGSQNRNIPPINSIAHPRVQLIVRALPGWKSPRAR